MGIECPTILLHLYSVLGATSPIRFAAEQALYLRRTINHATRAACLHLSPRSWLPTDGRLMTTDRCLPSRPRFPAYLNTSNIYLQRSSKRLTQSSANEQFAHVQARLQTHQISVEILARFQNASFYPLQQPWLDQHRSCPPDSR
jgi:hypothetical protein